MIFNIHHNGLETCQHYSSEVSAKGMLNINLKTAEKAPMLIQLYFSMLTQPYFSMLVQLYKCARLVDSVI